MLPQCQMSEWSMRFICMKKSVPERLWVVKYWKRRLFWLATDLSTGYQIMVD